MAVRLFETSIYLLGHFICGMTFFNFVYIKLCLAFLLQ